MTALACLAAYLVAAVVVPALLAAAIRHGEQQARRERALLIQRHARQS